MQNTLKFVSGFLILFLSGFSAFSQLVCDTYTMNKNAEERDSSVLSTKIILEQFTKDYISNNHKSDSKIIIPIVFHIVHNYGPENISKAQILDEIKNLNENFQKLNHDSADIENDFKSIHANCSIEFRLARIDPYGNCTDGITRTPSLSTYNGNDNTKIIAPSWDRSKYLNVWVVKALENGAAGYAYYPSSVNSSWGINRDGIIMLSSYVGGIGISNYTQSKTLTHEIGHYLNLMHTWGNSNSPGLSSNCDIDDGVEDTPNTIGHDKCDLGSSTCNDHDNVQNYMEYSYCTRMFTTGQKDRMRACLASNISQRNNLWSYNNLLATGTNDEYVSNQCIPTPDFSPASYFNCEGTIIQFNDLSYNCDSVNYWNWCFPGGNPHTSFEKNPSVTYPNPGSYNVILNVENSSGTGYLIKNNVINIFDPLKGSALPFYEDFELSAFPDCYSDTLMNWTINQSGNSWQRTNDASSSGDASLLIDNSSNQNTVNSIISPNIIINKNPKARLYFKYAYARKSASSKSKFAVYVSNDCGNSWHQRLIRSDNMLATNDGSFVDNFIPQENEWESASISFGPYYYAQGIKIKFESTSGSEDGNLYIDDIMLSVNTGINYPDSQNINDISVYPDPFLYDTKIKFEISTDNFVSLSVYDIIGNNIGEKSGYFTKGTSSLMLSDIIPEIYAGIYIIKIRLNNRIKTLKVICVK
jgi:PKD repeat protein